MVSTHKPIVAVVGRQNVGKSTLVNRIVGERKAIVDDLPGVTRDRAYYDATWRGREFTIIDTGGLVADADAGSADLERRFGSLVNIQIEAAMVEADVVVFTVDAQAGITPVDEAMADRVRRAGKPVVLVANKVDRPEQRAMSAEFYALGLGDPRALSAMHGDVGVGDLLDELLRLLPFNEMPDEAEAPVRIALVGRPNVGKSSILNALCGENRSIVSDVAGTTRDAIDVRLTHDGHEYTLIDTAGIRKKGKVDYGVEMFSVDRAIRALRQADVTVVVLDATENDTNQLGSMVTDQDKRIIETSNEAGRALVLVINKWDLVPDKTSKTIEAFKKQIYTEVPHARFAQVLFTSAAKGQRVTDILALCRTACENARRRIRTSLVNEVLTEAMTLSQPPTIKNRRLKLLYATQASAAPPTFILFVNDDKLMKESYQRYLEKKLRESFDFAGTPIVILARPRGDKAKPRTAVTPRKKPSRAKGSKEKLIKS